VTLYTLQNSFTGGKRKGSLRLSKKLPFFKVKEGTPEEEKEGKILLTATVHYKPLFLADFVKLLKVYF